MTKNLIVVGLGEVLWDCFPDQRRLLGGAPANFAFHVMQLGMKAYPISCLGNDLLGQKARQVLAERGVESEFLFECETHPTGTVEVALDVYAKPTYSITQNVAWDCIPKSDELIAFAKNVDAACFGTLAQRSRQSKLTIQSFLKAMPAESLKILDVNLRGEFYSKELIADSLVIANVLKLSDEELPVIADCFGLAGDVEQQLLTLIERFNLRLIAYTLGSDGSLLVTSGQTSVGKPVRIESIDSVGAGDSFTAALAVGLLHGFSLDQCNELANRAAAFVCSKPGACPKLPNELVRMVPTCSDE